MSRNIIQLPTTSTGSTGMSFDVRMICPWQTAEFRLLMLLLSKVPRGFKDQASVEQGNTVEGLNYTLRS